MGTVLLCDATSLTAYATLQLAAGESAFDRALSYAEAIPGEKRVLLLSPGSSLSVPDRWEGITLETADGTSYLDALIASGEGMERIVLFAGDEPLLQRSITDRLLALQAEYRTEYTFADGYPEGVAPEIIDTAILPVLRNLQQERPEPLGRDFIFRLLQHDINAFDLETEIAAVDLRLLRASITCDTRRNYLLSKRLLEEEIVTEDDILQTLPDRRPLLRTLPAYFSLQVTNRYPQRVQYEPFFDLQAEEEQSEMEVDQFRRLLEKIEEFAPESTVSIGYRGEPGLHEALPEMVRLVEESPTTSLYIETSGVGWSEEAVADLATMELKRTTIIVLLDAANETAYRELRGDGFTEACDFANRMRQAHPDRTYVQATRLKEYQETLEEFYKAWKEDKPIIQKYNHFCGELPDRQVTDLSPLERFPCWHLQRDMTLLLDGTVPRCQEDIHGSHILGNAFSEPLETIWERGEDLFKTHSRGEYPGICGACDEYYTFNA